MKKISAVLLIAVLACGLVFAGFSGSAKVGFGADFAGKTYGFTNTTSVTVDMSFFKELGSKTVEDGGIFAEITGELSMKFSTGADDPVSVKKGIPYVYASIKNATIGSADWSVSILEAVDVPNFAKSSIDTYKVWDKVNDWGYSKGDVSKNASYAVPYTKAPGVSANIFDWGVSVGLKGTNASSSDLLGDVSLSAVVATPVFMFADGLGVKAAAVYSQVASAQQAVGGSVEVSFVTDSVAATVASDLGYDFSGKKFGADVALNVAIAPVVVDFFYATSAVNSSSKQAVVIDGVTYNDKLVANAAVANLLSAKVALDLAMFDVPVVLTVTGKDLINTQDLSAEVAVALSFENESVLTLTPNGGYVIDSKAWNAGLKAEYAMDIMTAKAGIAISSTVGSNVLTIKPSASVSSDALIPGATLALTWADAAFTSDAAAWTQAGSVMASCKIKF